MSKLAAAWLLARKDLRLFFRDRTGMVLGFLLPIALVAVFGYVLKIAFGSSGVMSATTLWVADVDGSERSARFVEMLRQADVLRVRPRPGEDALAPEDLREKIADGDAHHGLVIAAGFQGALERGELPELVLVRDPGRELEDLLTRIGLMQAFMAATDGELWPATMGRLMGQMGMDGSQVDRLVSTAQGMQRIIAAFVDEEDVPSGGVGEAATPDIDFSAFFDGMAPVTTEDIEPPDRPKFLTYQVAQGVSGVVVMMLMFGLMACSSTLIAERDQGTLRRLLVSAVPRDAVLWGKFLMSLCIGVLQLLVLFAFGEVVFRVGAFRDPLTLLVLSITWAATATSFGMLVAAWARTQKQAEGLSTLLILVMAALGGCWFPVQIANLPLAAEIVTRSTLTYWAMSGYQGMFWNQWSFTHPEMLRAIGVLWGFALVGAWLALRLYRRRYC